MNDPWIGISLATGKKTNNPDVIHQKYRLGGGVRLGVGEKRPSNRESIYA
jgi:hypothetical protein